MSSFCFSHLYHIWYLINYLINTLGVCFYFYYISCLSVHQKQQQQKQQLHTLDKENILWFLKYIQIPFSKGLKIILFSFCAIFLVTYWCHRRPGNEMRAGKGAQRGNGQMITRLSNSMKHDGSWVRPATLWWCISF